MSVYLLGIDVGTHSTKGVLVSREGRVAGHRVTQHDVSRPRPGHAEHDADDVWWRDVSRIIAALLNDSGVNPVDVKSVGVSGLAPAMVPVDSDGRPLRPAILYGIDTRAETEVAWFNAELGLDAPGTPPAVRMQAQSLAPKIAWFREHEPARWTSTDRILGSTGYVVHRLTGTYVVDSLNAAAFSPLYNPAENAWDATMCSRFGFPLEMLPCIREATDVVGGVTPEASHETGLAVGTPVICGSMDGLAEYLASGATRDGDACVLFGSTMCVCVLTSEFREHPQLYSGRTLVPGLSRMSGGMATSGALVQWFRDNFAPRETLDALDDEAATIAPGSDGLIVLPYFSGERTPIFDTRARGLILGLTVSHTRAHVYRAVLEGIAYALKHHLELMAEVDVVPGRVLAIGGGSRSELWTQIVSDVTGFSLECVHQPHGAELAAAFLAGYGAGVFDNFSELADKWVRTGRTALSRPAITSVYDRYYAVYRRLYDRTRDDMHELACLSERLA
jgi:xylulokinase